MLKFVMYTVIEALVPLTNMVVSVVRERSDIISLHEQILEQLRRQSSEDLILSLNTLMDYLLEKFRIAS